jgi:hypothetical protein
MGEQARVLDLSDAVELTERSTHIPQPIAATVAGAPWRVWTNGHVAVGAPGAGGTPYAGVSTSIERLLGEALAGVEVDRFPIRELAAFAECIVVAAGDVVEPCSRCEGAKTTSRYCMDCENVHQQPCCRCAGSGERRARTSAEFSYQGRTMNARLLAPLANGIDAAGGCAEAVVVAPPREGVVHVSPLALRAADGSWACVAMPLAGSSTPCLPTFPGGKRTSDDSNDSA